MSRESPIDSCPQVLAEVQAGDGLSLAGAGRLLPAHRGSKSVAPSTLLRWIRKGCKATDGRLVHLEACRVGVRWVTSRSALRRFVMALTAADPMAPTALPRSPAARNAAAAVAGRKLAEEFGV